VNSALFETFRQSGIVGQLIILFLITLSVYAWYIIIDKLRFLNTAEKSSKAFLRKFTRERERLFSLRFPTELAVTCPLYNIYQAGTREIGPTMNPEAHAAAHSNYGLSSQQLEHVENSLRRAVSNERMGMEKTLIVLAVTATISPLMGLLGTVWGIMNAFRGMAATGSASIGTVAPGISEALVTTVVGLLVAIPALAGYNVILNKIKHLTEEMNNFAADFISSISRGNAAYR
jgi:biopolymer transport protein TolQ